jgi:hypothetical protein
MGGFRCRLGWCLGPGAVFKTAAPYSGFFLMVVVSVVLVCGLWLPGLLASWLRRPGSGLVGVVRSWPLWYCSWRVLAMLVSWVPVGIINHYLGCLAGDMHCW